MPAATVKLSLLAEATLQSWFTGISPGVYLEAMHGKE
jgi:hypothetical protein